MHCDSCFDVASAWGFGASANENTERGAGRRLTGETVCGAVLLSARVPTSALLSSLQEARAMADPYSSRRRGYELSRLQGTDREWSCVVKEMQTFDSFSTRYCAA